MSYRPKHHLTPPQGRLNDPNGMMLLGDELHVFYQHDPSFPAEPKRTGWGHAVTTLGSGVWSHLPDALYPGQPYDVNGCYSGSGVVHDGRVRLFYTGNVKRDGERFTSQNIVDVEDIEGPMGGVYRRHPSNPVIDGPAEGYTAHYRDPHVTQAQDGTWRMVLGAQRVDGTGAAVLYTSDDLEHWEFAGEVEFAGLNYNTASAFMWECPNLLRMRDCATGRERDVFVFCPQFPDSDECGYVVGKLDGLRFEVDRDFTPLDYGTEFYAPQLISDGDGGALMLGWMGLPARDDTPTMAAEGWVHQLTLVRELSLVDDHLTTTLQIPQSCEMLVDKRQLGAQPWSGVLIAGEDNVCVTVAWRPDGKGRGMVSVEAAGRIRWAECAEGELVVTADGAAVECTAGDGEVAFSFALFAPGGAQWSALTSQ